MDPNKIYHPHWELSSLMRWSDGQLKKFLKHPTENRSMTPDECREVFIDWLRRGYDNLPTCNNYDEKGCCKGYVGEERDGQGK